MKAIRAAFVAVALIIMALPCALMPVLPSTLGAENRLPAEWPALKTEEIQIVLTPTWADSGQVCLRQTDPLPLTVVNITAEVALGG